MKILKISDNKERKRSKSEEERTCGKGGVEGRGLDKM